MSLKDKYNYVIVRKNQSLGLSSCAYDYVLELEKENEKLKAELELYKGTLKREHEAIHRVNELEEENEELKLENFNLREDVMIQKMSLPSEEIKDKSFYDLLDMPSYEELNKKYLNAVADYEQEKCNVEELKKQLQTKDEGFKAVNEELCEYAEENSRLSELWCDSRSKIRELGNQQKEFVKYLEEKEKQFDISVEPCLAGVCKEILAKYKEIVGDVYK